MRRRTYTERRVYAARVMKFRRAVYAARRDLTPGCLLLLLRLSDDMNEKCIVSVPRSVLAEDLDATPARITEWIGEAVQRRFLSQVVRARPKVTAVYQGVVRGTPQRTSVRGTPQVSSEGYAPADLSTGIQRSAGEGSHEVQRTEPSATTGQEAPTHDRNEGTYEKAEDHQAVIDLTACEWHRPFACPTDCRNAERRSA